MRDMRVAGGAVMKTMRRALHHFIAACVPPTRY